MIIDHQNHYVFVAVPKTASISIQFSLGHGNDIPEPHLYHQSITTALIAHPECVNYYKFGFVRNPWDRLLSLYYDFTLLRGNQYSAKVRHEQPLFGEFKDFTDFCMRVGSTAWMRDIFFTSQCDLLDMANSTMDFVGRFENLRDDFHFICTRLGIFAELQCRNSGKYDKKSYRDYYSEEARLAIAQLYASDIETFEYEF